MNHYFTNDEDLKSNIKEIKYSILSSSLNILSDAGVFSKKHIDYGSDILIKEYISLNPKKYSVLDLGCGYGVIGIVVAKETGSEVTFSDINKRALHLTRRNLKLNKLEGLVIESDGFENINDKYDRIISNPPIRIGKARILEILSEAKNHLKKDGELWFVIRKDQGALTIKKELEKFYKIEITNKIKGYFTFQAKKC